MSECKKSELPLETWEVLQEFERTAYAAMKAPALGHVFQYPPTPWMWMEVRTNLGATLPTMKPVEYQWPDNKKP